MIDIANYSPAFERQVVELILAIQRDEFGFDIDVEDQPDLLDVQNFYLSGSGGFWLALSEGEVVGTIALRDIGNSQGALRKMFVKDTYRGKQHSVASRLLDRLVHEAASSRTQEIYLGTTERFAAAHRFYEKNGFLRVAPDSLPAAFPRMSLDTRFYRRTVP